MPKVYVIAGPNGAGKTSTSMTLLANYLDLKFFVNADEIARGLSPLDPGLAAIDAGRLMIKRMARLIEQRTSFAFETTLSGLGHRQTLKKCQLAGYEIHIVFLYLSSVEMAFQRVRNRVAQGGHDVPQDDIRRRYHNGIRRLFCDYAECANTVTILDNSDGMTQPIASRDHLGNWRLADEEKWHKIRKQAHDDSP